MMMLVSLTTTSALISLIFVLATLSTSEKSIKERDKMTPFECGFSPFKKARAPFSLRFFMTTLIFLIFDMEVALVLPMGILEKITSFTVWALTATLVVMILTAGLLHEWKNGALNWIK